MQMLPWLVVPSSVLKQERLWCYDDTAVRMQCLESGKRCLGPFEVLNTPADLSPHRAGRVHGMCIYIQTALMKDGNVYNYAD